MLDIKNRKMSVKAASMHYGIPRTTLIQHLKNNVSSPGKNKLGDALSSVTNNITEKPQQADGAERSVAIIEIAPHQSNEQNVAIKNFECKWSTRNIISRIDTCTYCKID